MLLSASFSIDGTQYMHYVHARTDRPSTVTAINLWIHMALTEQGKPGFAKEENSRGSVASLSQPRQGKPGTQESIVFLSLTF